MSNNKKLSSIEWLIDNLYLKDSIKWIKIIEQAKAMHKEEMFEYIKQKYCIGHKSLEFHKLEFEHYYNQTFGGER